MNTKVLHKQNGKINITFNDQHDMKDDTKNVDYLTNNKQLKIIDEQFSSFVGLSHFKKIIKEIYATRLINERRAQVGLGVNKQVLHMLFKGNPGTGKTTIARELAKVLFHLNILSKGHFIEAERADLVGEYIGQTAQKTRAIVQKAIGGVLFIDEAYSLARGGHKDFGREAIDTLVKQMEDHANDFVLILAGYPDEMEQFILLNPGLKSRFPFHIHFQDYTISELIEIAEQIALEREYELSPCARLKLKQLLYEKTMDHLPHFANARYIRNIIEQSIRLHAIRLLHDQHFSIKDLSVIKGNDIKPD